MTGSLDRLRAALSDRYAIERELGAGGMATVYLAEDLKHHREVAVKVLRPELAATLGPERFLREIEVAARLQHPHILPLHDSGEAEGFLYYVMPYVEGHSLRERLDRDGELPIGETVRILKEVVDALAHAHEHGVVHRDIKPDNVMLSGRHAMVTDFGVAKAVSEATGREKLTTAGVALGTPAYMAPEQASASEHIDHRADIYAVGVLAYELLAGRAPFAGPTSQAILAAHITETPVPVTSHRDAVPAALAQVVMRCLEKKPADRWQTAEELLPQLEALATPSGGITPSQTQPVTAAPVPRSKTRNLIIAGVSAVAVVLIIGSQLVGGSAADFDRRSIAVLPLTDVGASQESASFTGGIHDDIITQLSKVSALKVIARPSVLEYENTTKDMRQIGEELGVANLLTGSVQRAAGQVRINLQLIDARSNRNVWAESYQRELTVANIFAVQSDIAQQIASALQATLTATEQERLESTPTENLEAYELYRRGIVFEARSNTDQDVRLAVDMYQRAVDLDANFALAWARLSRVHSKMWWYAYDRGAGRLPSAKRAVDRALALDPDLPEARMALGYYYYWGLLDYDAAMSEFDFVQATQPNNGLVQNGIGSVRRRQGRWEEALAGYQRQIEINPRVTSGHSFTAQTYLILRNATEAAKHFEHVIQLNPGAASAYGGKANARLWLEGDIQGAVATIDDAEQLGMSLPRVRFALSLVERDYREALQVVASLPVVDDNQAYYGPRTQWYAVVYQLDGDSVRAHTYFDSARVHLEQQLLQRSDDARLHSALGLAYAGLGRKDDAIAEGHTAVELLPVEREAVVGTYRRSDLALIYAMVGEHELAMDELEFLLSIPSEITIPMLRLDPQWDPVRENPRFRALVADGR